MRSNTGRKRVLLAGLYHETHTFVETPTTLTDFSRRKGAELLEAAGEPSPLGGAIDTALLCEWEVIPAIDYRARPGGTVENAAFEAWWEAFRAAADAALQQEPLDGLFLILHGAMVTDACLDVEGELLERIRAIPGLEALPLAGVTDLHANFTPRMARFSNALITYRRNPHTDARETAIRAVHVLDRLMETGAAARTLYHQPPLVLAPTATGTTDEPMLTLERLAREMEAAHHGLLAVNVHAGFAFADTHHTGVSFTLNILGEANQAERLLDSLGSAALQTSISRGQEQIPVEEALEQAARASSGPILLVEPSDNIGAGAPGAGVSLLKAFVARDIQGAGVIINDQEAVSMLSALSPGESATLRIGGKGSALYEPASILTVTLRSRSDGRFFLEDPHSHLASMVGAEATMGPCAVVTHRGVTILLTSLPTPPFDLAQWRSQGIAPEALSVIGVKAAVAHRQAYDPIASASFYVRTPGPCSTDLRVLPFQHLRRPVLPLDAFESGIC